MSGYLDELAGRLRERGVPAERVTTTIDDLAAFLADSGADPEAEFGAVDDFAEQLAPPDSTQVWRWTAYTDERTLNAYGDQGWEVERVDGLGRFFSRRDTEHPQRWEYRLEQVFAGDHARLTARLAPDDWEPCGSWLFYAVYKRPKAASVGPAATLAAPPAPPPRRALLDRRFAVVLAVVGVAVIAAGVLQGIKSGEVSSGIGMSAGLLVGGSLALGFYAAVITWTSRR